LLPTVGRARDLDVEFLELFADITAQLSTLRIAISDHPDFSEEGAQRLKEQEEQILGRYERIIAWLSKGNDRG
jgi:hypothetical protein